jgi:hypothetical protein
MDRRLESNPRFEKNLNMDLGAVALSLIYKVSTLRVNRPLENVSVVI